MPSEPTPPPRPALTRAGLAAALFAGTVAVLLITLALRRTMEGDSIRAWIYPGSSRPAFLTNSGTRTAVFATTDSFTNVADWYSDQLKMGRTGNPSFRSRSRGPFSFGQHPDETARLGSRHGTNAATESFFVARREQSMIVHASWNDTEQSTTISITVREPSPTTNAFLAWNVVNTLTPPGCASGSAGSIFHIAAQALTHSNSIARLRSFWEREIHPATNVVGTGIPDGEFAQATLVRLPMAASAQASESDLLLITPHSLSLIHLATASNQTSQIIIGSITQ